MILAAFGPPTAELSRAGKGRGGPPVPVNQTMTFSGYCGFDVQVTLTGKEGLINLPSGGLIVTGDQPATFTNLSDPTKTVTLNAAGAFHVSFDQNGNQIFMATGRNGVFIKGTGMLILVGNFTFVLDPNNHLISGPTGTGTIIDICQLIN